MTSFFGVSARFQIPRSSFIRKPHDTDPSLIFSRCARCNAPIGAASTHTLVKLMEDQHTCKLQLGQKVGPATAR